MTGHRSRVRRFASWRYVRWALAMPALPLALWACNSHPLEEPVPQPELQTDQYYEVNPVRDIDILFLVDNSPSMKEEQASLSRNFPRMIAELQKIPGGLPNVHIGVISSDLGGGATSPGGNCARPGGDRGHLQVRPNCGLDPMTSRYLVSLNSGKENNFTGDLGGVFGCLATLGDQGCGYEHQLEAIRQALNGGEGVNTGFLRKDAYLGIIIITDEDDCSAPVDTTLFGEMRAGEAASLRCATEGHLCGNMKPPANAAFSSVITACKSNENGRLSKVQDFVDFVRATKDRPDQQIIVSGIFGWPKPATAPDGYNIAQRDGVWDFGPACTAGNNSTFGSAAAGIRVKQFVESFGENGTIDNICDGDFGPAMQKIGDKLKSVLSNTCVTAKLIDRDLVADGVQADCQVADRAPIPGSSKYMDTPLPNCSSGKMPCWTAQPDPANCAASGYKIDVNRGGEMAPQGTTQVIKCLTCARADHMGCQY